MQSLKINSLFEIIYPALPYVHISCSQVYKIMYTPFRDLQWNKSLQKYRLTILKTEFIYHLSTFV